MPFPYTFFKLMMTGIFILNISMASAQAYYFPKNYLSDSTKFNTNLKLISKDMVADVRQDSSSQSYSNLANLHFAAGQLEAFLQAADQHFDHLSRPEWNYAPFFMHRIYADAMLQVDRGTKKLVDALDESLDTYYNDLNVFSIPYAWRKVRYPQETASLKELLDETIEGIINDKEYKDSISLSQGIRLARYHNLYKISKEVGSILQQLIIEKDKSRYVVIENVMIKTPQDGELQAKVIYKKSIKKAPAILTYNIYVSDGDYTNAMEAAVRGYVGVSVNTRGKGSSKNEINPFEYDAIDAYPIIDWISKQAWSDGTVGMLGGSYLGFSQWASLKKPHPALKTIVPQVSVGIGIDYPATNNVFMSYMLQWIHYVTNNRETDYEDFGNYTKWNAIYRKWYEEGLPFRKLDSLNDETNKIFQRWLDHPAYDEYWQNMVPYKKEFANIDIPILTTTGYYDADQLGALYYLKEHYKWNPDAEHYLVVGPYSHGGGQHYQGETIRGYTLDSVAHVHMTELAYEWFDYTLRGQEKPALLKDKVNFQVMNANRWEHSPGIDMMADSTLRFYLTSISDGQNYELSPKQNDPNTFIQHKIDLTVRDDLDAIRANSTALLQKEVYKGNMLTFLSAPFEKEVSIVGAFKGALSLAINKKDLDIYMKLYEVTPEGEYFYLADYLARGSYTRDIEKRKLITPGKKTTLPITRSFMASKKMEAGSRLMVLLGVKKDDQWEINYGSGKEVSSESIADAGPPMLIKWYSDSHIDIGVIFE